MAMVGERAGILSFLFCDIQGSTALLGELGEADYRKVIERFRGIMRKAIAKHAGTELGTEGDGFLASFGRPSDAIEAATAAQKAIGSSRLPRGTKLLVRMGIHSGEATEAAGTVVGMGLHIAARVMSAAHGGQVLVSGAAASLVKPDGLEELGSFRLKDAQEPLVLYQLDTGKAIQFPPPRTLDLRRNNLPDQITSFIGRDHEVSVLKDLVRKRRLVTLVGPGGAGKTRLAVEIASSLLEDFKDGVWLIELSTIQDPGLIDGAVADSLAKPLAAGGLAATIKDASMLLILDNSEHLIPSVTQMATDVLARCPGVRILATSRQPLSVTGEQIYEVPPLSLESEEGAEPEALRFFIERALENDPSFSIVNTDRAALAEVCGSLDCLPLAMELAASKLRTMGLDELRTGLKERMRMLGDSSDAPRNLRSVLDWSFDALGEPEKALLRRLSIFAGSFTVASAGAVCGSSPLSPDVSAVMEKLVLRSLVKKQSTPEGTTYRLLETVRDYAEEKLATSKETARTTIAYVEHFASKIDIKRLKSLHRDPKEWFTEEELSESRLRRKSALLGNIQFSVIAILAFFATFALQLPTRFFGGFVSGVPLLRFWLAILTGAAMSELLTLPIHLYRSIKLEPVIEAKPFRPWRFFGARLSNPFQFLAILGPIVFLIWVAANATPFWWLWTGLALPLFVFGIGTLAMRVLRRTDVTDPALRAEIARLVRASGKKVERIVLSKQGHPATRDRPYAFTISISGRGTRVLVNQPALEGDPGVRRAVIAQQLADGVSKWGGPGARLFKRFFATSLLVITLGILALGFSSRAVLHLGGLESLKSGDAGSLVASGFLLWVMVVGVLFNWWMRRRAFRTDLVAAAITREPEAFALSLREAMVQTKADLSPLRRIGLKAEPAARIAVVAEWEKAQRAG